MSILEKSIVATVAYYDVLDFPLTAFEVYRYLINRETQGKEQELKTWHFRDIQDSLETGEILKGILGHKNGFYFLKGRDELVEKRIGMRKINDQKWKRTKAIVWWFQLVPFMRMVLASGSLAVGNTDEESDLDLLIVAREGRIWTTRFLLSLLVHLMGVRRHGDRIKDRICLNHYITDVSLAIPFKSLYNAQTYSHFIPVLILRGGTEEQDIFYRFQKENSWIGEYLLHYHPTSTQNLKKINESSLLRLLRVGGETVLSVFLGNILEKGLKQYQLFKIEQNPSRSFPGGRIVAEDQCLAFHPFSPEKNILERYNSAMAKFGLLEFANENDSGLR